MKKLLTFFLIVVCFIAMPTVAFAGYLENEPEIKICAKEIELKSKLRNRYSAYYVTVENKSDMVLKLVEGQFEGGEEGGEAYVNTRKNADKILENRVQAWENWGLWTLGGAWALAFLISPFEWYYNVFTNRRMKDESIKYSEIVFFHSAFYPDEKMEKYVLFPVVKSFYIRLVFRDEATGKLYTVTKNDVDECY
jgi:hypothetical protein